MTLRCSVFIATSLDGYIARADSSIDWLEDANATLPGDEDCGYGAFFATVDAVVMGRNTFEQIASFREWPYGATPVIVLSRTLRALPAQVPASVRLSTEPPGALVRTLAAQGLGHLYVDGGQTIQAFLAAGLIQELTITVIPVLLGTGRSLFGALPRDLPLQLLSSKAYPFGFVQSRYRIVRGASLDP